MEATTSRAGQTGTWTGGEQNDRRPIPVLFWVLQAVLALAAVGGLVFGWDEAGTMVLLMILAVPFGVMAARLPRDLDSSWFGNLILVGLMVKLAASGLRYWALQVLYNGIGDATGYHNHGVQLASVWRSFQIPEFEAGTEFIQIATGLLYVPFIPTKLGGFFIFSCLALIGQVLFYLALRVIRPSPQLKWYAALIFLFPNIVYWPSSIGKESLMILFLGIVTYGIARLFVSFETRWLAVVSIGIVACAVVRSHIALLVGVALAAALLMAVTPRQAGHVIWRRLAIVGIALVGVAFVVQYAISDFGVDLSGGISETLLEEELDPIFTGVESQTSRGGSTVEGSAIRSPADVPEAVLRVIFQPLPWDAHNMQSLVNSFLEGTLLLGLFIWRMPTIVRCFRARWRSPLVLFSLVYTAGFVFGHSAVLNLGIMARQRSQLIPYVLLLLVELGAPKTEEVDSSVEVASADRSSAMASPAVSSFQLVGHVGDFRPRDSL